MIRMVKDDPTPRRVREFPLARTLKRVAQSPLRDILPRSSRPGVISLALGMPAGEMFPGERFAQASVRALAAEQATQYGEPFPALKKHIVKLMAQRGVTCTEDQVFLTAGGQQALSLITQLLLNPGDPVIAEDTIYDGLQMVLQTQGAKVLAVSTSLETGMDLDAVEALLEAGERPAFIYTIPEGHNPLGVSMSPENRGRLVYLARRWRVPILEDDAYGFLHYEGTRPPIPMRAIDDQWVFYTGSFSKILAPALRLGWIVVPSELIPQLPELTAKLSILKQAADFDTSTLIQRTVSAYLDTGDLETHLEAIRKEYKKRRDAMLQALKRHFPHEIRWNKPKAGLFLWLEMPPEIQTFDLLSKAIDTERVAFLPGQAFAMGSKRRWNSHCIRLSFGNCPVDKIEEGIARLGRVVKNALVEMRRGPAGLSGGSKKLGSSIRPQPGPRRSPRRPYLVGT